MSNPRTFQIQEISAHPGTIPGKGTRREEEVCKYIDVTTCIGCKALSGPGHTIRHGMRQ